ncbi:hypothetical protein C8F04DRAFT_1263194 [Mycena alexandri]|uniref:Uncharacterized protein n=1 Tax=Mycena alexandri TaxID=1745969 RepID=A0AAD6SNJ3_9AGAR|nr:hypothetical protein C8F04DRAFT_1263194 [Mycena alexandri]
MSPTSRAFPLAPARYARRGPIIRGADMSARGVHTTSTASYPLPVLSPRKRKTAAEITACQATYCDPAAQDGHLPLVDSSVLSSFLLTRVSAGAAPLHPIEFPQAYLRLPARARSLPIARVAASRVRPPCVLYGVESQRLRPALLDPQREFSAGGSMRLSTSRYRHHAGVIRLRTPLDPAWIRTTCASTSLCEFHSYSPQRPRLPLAPPSRMIAATLGRRRDQHLCLISVGRRTSRRRTLLPHPVRAACAAIRVNRIECTGRGRRDLYLISARCFRAAARSLESGGPDLSTGSSSSGPLTHAYTAFARSRPARARGISALGRRHFSAEISVYALVSVRLVQLPAACPCYASGVELTVPGTSSARVSLPLWARSCSPPPRLTLSLMSYAHVPPSAPSVNRVEISVRAWSPPAGTVLYYGVGCCSRALLALHAPPPASTDQSAPDSGVEISVYA